MSKEGYIVDFSNKLGHHVIFNIGVPKSVKYIKFRGSPFVKITLQDERIVLSHIDYYTTSLDKAKKIIKDISNKLTDYLHFNEEYVLPIENDEKQESVPE